MAVAVKFREPEKEVEKGPQHVVKLEEIIAEAEKECVKTAGDDKEKLRECVEKKVKEKLSG